MVSNNLLKAILLHIIVISAILSDNLIIFAQENKDFTLEKKRENFKNAYAAFSKGEIDISEKLFRGIVDSYEELQDYSQYFIAEILSRRNEHDSAISGWRLLIDKHPKSLWVEATRLRIAESFLEKGDYSSAEKDFDEFIKKYPASENIPRAQYKKAVSLEKLGLHRESALEYFTTWMNYPLSPFSDDALNDSKRLDRDSGLNLGKPTIEDYYNRALKIYTSGQYSKALKEFKDILQNNPDYSMKRELLLRIGISQQKLGKLDEALETLLNLTGNFRDSSVIPEASIAIARIYWKMDRDDEAISILLRMINDYPKSDHTDDAYYLLAAILEENKKYSDAIVYYEKLLSSDSKSPFADDALWRIGWINYINNSYDKTINTFQRLQKEYPSSTYINASFYWIGRIYEKKKRYPEAIELYSRVVRDAPRTYYGIFSQKHLTALSKKKMADVRGKQRAIIRLDKDPVNILRPDAHFTKADELLSMNLEGFGLNELETVFAVSIGNRNKLYGLSSYYFSKGFYHQSLRILRRFFSSLIEGYAGNPEISFYRMVYPEAFKDKIKKYSRLNGVDPFLVAAMIREESNFNPKAVSSAGARGLMQMMPATAKEIIRIKNNSSINSLDLFEPDFNISTGTKYISSLIQKFEKNEILAISSYNAGPHKVIMWLPDNKKVDMEDFVEDIPFEETKAFVKRVITSKEEYRRIYGKDLSWRLP